MKKIISYLISGIIFSFSSSGQITNFIYAINNVSSGVFYFSKIEIATGVITNLQLVPIVGISTAASSCIDNNTQKYYFCTGTSLIIFDAVNGNLVSNVTLPIGPMADFHHIQFNPCDSDIYGIVNNFGSSISFARYHIINNSITIISTLSPNLFFCGCMSFIDPDYNIYGFQNI